MAEIMDNDASTGPATSTADKMTSINPDETGEPSSNAVVELGGQSQQESFALLDGIFQEPESTEQERITINITRLPALLGRTNDSDNKNPFFFGLGKKKALSRKHCTIYYRDKEGGNAEWDEAKQTMVYKDPKTIKQENGSQPAPKPNPHHDTGEGGLPSNGFFVIQCLSKNRIVVDKVRIEQGESIVLRPGSAIRISSYMLYFLLPTDVEPTTHKIEVPLTAAEKAAASKTTKKKPKAAAATKAKKATASKKRPAPTTSTKKSKKTKKYNFEVPTSSLAINQLDEIPEEELMERIDEAVTKGMWDRRHHCMGTIICNKAVLYAGSSPEIKKIVKEEEGIARSDLMEWVAKSEKYGNWVQHMLTNMEQRSYQAAFTKCLLTAGYERKSGVGRYIKWDLPSVLPSWKGKEKNLLGARDATPKKKPQPDKEKVAHEQEIDNEDEKPTPPNDDEDDEDEDDSDNEELPEETTKDDVDEGSGDEEEEEEEEGGDDDVGGSDEDEEEGNNSEAGDSNREQVSESGEGEDEVVV